ncbi:MAG: helix-turn-helix transcriptional regulator [Anaerolineaceae bacterium]|nr:helix-turn-helix transcriptional regulator [Anaerolineaceae bacterium]
MENITVVVAENLKRIRDERNLSLDKLAELTGVSKSMLGQIERGDSSPTISVTWKIVNGLKISFTSLVSSPQSDISIIRKSEASPLLGDNGKYRSIPYFPIEEGRQFETYVIEIDKGGYLSAEAHPDGAEEFIQVFQGELTIRVADQEYNVSEGDAIRFKADQAHAYHNSGQELIKFNLLIFYPNFE